jgi:tetratricopeptide (TPR) repeat protein
MRVSRRWSAVLGMSLISALLSGCFLTPTARKERLVKDGQRYFAKGEYQLAAAEFNKAIRIDPGFVQAHLLLAETYQNLHQPNQAYREYSTVTELRPDDDQARMAMTNLLIAGKYFSLAREQTDLLMKRNPKDPAVYVLVSSLLAAQGQIPEAIAEMQKAIALAPNRWQLYLAQGLLDLQAKDPDAAEASFKKVVELDPKAMQGRLVLGSFYQAQHRMDEAVQQYQQAIAMDPGSFEPRAALARLYLMEKNNSAANEVLDQAAQAAASDSRDLPALIDLYGAADGPEKALSECATIYAQHPADLDLKKKYIQLLIAANRLQLAGTLDQEILKANPMDPDALVFEGELQISQGNVAGAVQTLRTAIQIEPGNGQAHYALGVALQRQGDMGHAQDEWRAALQRDPSLVAADRELAAAALEQGDMSALQLDASQIIALQPQSPDGYALRALSNINRRNYADAESDVTKAIAVGPKSSLAYVELGNLSLAEKRYPEAVKAYQTALDDNPDSSDALRGLMSTWFAQGQTDKAIAAAHAQIDKSPSDHVFYDLLGDGLFHVKGDLNGAETAFEKSLQLDGQDSSAAIALCEVRAAKGETGQAIAAAQQALKVDPRQPELLEELGDLYQSRAEWAQAEGAYRSTLALIPGNPGASEGLAHAMLESGGNLDDILTLAQTAAGGMPDSPAVFDTLGWTYYRKGAYQLALQNLEEALRLQTEFKVPDNPDIHFHLGFAYEKTGQTTLARQNFEHILKEDPGYPGAAEVRKQLAALKS